ncbi:MAG: hypothetical protein KGL53_04965, partial [Elusimicrobia bacterium]|nr:hypothetical protein [Elusimicrobiota bacterium]
MRKTAPLFLLTLLAAAPASADTGSWLPGWLGGVTRAAGDAVVTATAPGLWPFLTQTSANAARWARDGSYPVRQGNQVDLYVDGQESWKAIIDNINQATKYVYATFAYVDLRFHPIPGDKRTILDFLDAAAKRGVDVKVVIWDPALKTPDTLPDPKAAAIPGINAGKGTMEARWDVAHGKGPWLPVTGCHHQKTFAMDGPDGRPVSFVGGINAVQSYWSTQAHSPDDARRLADLPPGVTAPPTAERLAKTPPLHDVFSRIEGPSAVDVACNFSERFDGATYKHEGATADAPSCASLRASAANVPALPPGRAIPAQIVRTIAPDDYKTLPKGEESIREVYIRAILSAKKYIYFEDQYFYDHEITVALQLAANRGVKVIGLLTAHPDEGQFTGAVETPLETIAQGETVELTKLAGHGNIALYSPAVAEPDPANPGKYKYQEIYVHA